MLNKSVISFWKLFQIFMWKKSFRMQGVFRICQNKKHFRMMLEESVACLYNAGWCVSLMPITACGASFCYYWVAPLVSRAALLVISFIFKSSFSRCLVRFIWKIKGVPLILAHIHTHWDKHTETRHVGTHLLVALVIGVLLSHSRFNYNEKIKVADRPQVICLLITKRALLGSVWRCCYSKNHHCWVY